MTMERAAKRQRVVKACCTCQAKKIRCDGKQPACSNCWDRGVECTYVDSEKKRGPPKRENPGANHLSRLEQRILRMEGLLASGGPRANPSPTDSDGPTVEVSTDAVSTTARAQAAPYAEEVPGENGKAETQQGASEDLQLTLISSEVAHPFKPSQSLPDMQGSDTQSTITCVPDAEFSPSVQWIMDKADEKQAFQGGFAVDVLSNPATPGKWMNFLSVRMKPPVHAPLPPQDEAMRLLEVFFSAHNRFFPLYDYPSFMLLAQQEFAGQPDKRVGWWASLNAALAVGIRLQNPADTSRESSAQAWGYMHNALSVLPELTMRSDDLLSAQALLCMAVFTRGNGEPPSSAMLVSSALRLLQIMGLRQGKPSTERDPVIARQSNRTFWFAYMLDTENTMVSNLPLLQDPSTLNIELPAEESPDGLGTIPLEDGTGQFNLFRAMSELSVIAAKAFQALYAPNVRQRPETEIVKTMLDLEQQLEEWKAAIDIDFQPEYEINTADPYLRHYILVLHFQYYTCLSNIHFAALTLRRSTGDTSCQNQIISSRAIYSSCARAMVRMTRNVAVDIPAFVWRILCYPILASMALFVGIREDPTAPRALTDAALLGSWTSLLSKMKDHDSGSVGQIRRLLLELERLSREVVNQAQSTSKGNKCTVVPGKDPDGSSSIGSGIQTDGLPDGLSGGGFPLPLPLSGSGPGFMNCMPTTFLDPQVDFTNSLPLWTSDAFPETDDFSIHTPFRCYN